MPQTTSFSIVIPISLYRTHATRDRYGDTVVLVIERTYFAVALMLLFGLLFAWERRAPLRRSTRPLTDRLLINAGVSALAFATAMLLVRPTALAVLQWASTAPFGLVHVMPMAPAAQ